MSGELSAALEEEIQRSWLKQKPRGPDIGLMAADGTWLILRVMRELPPRPRVNGVETDGDKVVWRFGDRMIVARTLEARFLCLCELLEMVPDATVLTSTRWGEE